MTPPPDRKEGSGGPGDIPGGVYLCQVAGEVSCGACCGLYNLPTADRNTLAEILKSRSVRFSRVFRSIDSILGFGEGVLAEIGGAGPYPDFHHCPFVGFVGTGQDRIGCLLHPLAEGNDGIDYRGLSYYGGLACRVYFCPAHRKLEPEWKKILRESFSNWFLYGLIVTEVEFLTGFFESIERRIGRPLAAGDILEDPHCKSALMEFASLKIEWPFRPPGVPGPANYFFQDGKYLRPAVRYPGNGQGRSLYDAVFRALGSVFETERDLNEAQQRIAGPIARIVDRIRARENDPVAADGR